MRLPWISTFHISIKLCNFRLSLSFRYCRFYVGRRTEDDRRQVDRWLRCVGDKGRWRNNLITKIVRAGCVYDNTSVSPVVRQTLQHWGYTLTKEDFDKYAKQVKTWQTGTWSVCFYPSLTLQQELAWYLGRGVGKPFSVREWPVGTQGWGVREYPVVTQGWGVREWLVDTQGWGVREWPVDTQGCGVKDQPVDTQGWGWVNKWHFPMHAKKSSCFKQGHFLLRL